ncbi:MAG TPA: DUF1206 domain-containing protein [Candidatus Udaeobacter sp.]|jgi:hypothetical protein|nr:DUF1206 domain-containing protein [Candidatus Udaeobacter sp.]
MTALRDSFVRTSTPTLDARRSVGSWPGAGPRLLEALMRFGYVVRGALYVIPGLLALGLATGRHRTEMTPAAAIQAIGHQPFGRVLLAVVAIGLLGYSLWGFARSLFDALGKGGSLHGLAQRFGYLTSALAYGGLLVLTLHLILHSDPGESSSWVVRVRALPLGAWVLGAIGVGWIIGAGLLQIVSGWRRTFEADLDLGVSERRWASGLGRVGLISRGVVFTVVGILLVTSAVRANQPEGTTMNSALLEILHQPFGRVFLVAAAIGLIAFGAFSVLCARWMRVRVGRRSVPSPL